ncbi:MAG TPA: flagellar assembly protein FliH [Rhodocyclaceae bacterium]|nr:flagellar assembly protein FliH [Rhodocyclaceae bacterium]HMV19795.1 flagellar assembly protein FliH [Rhodocyclaceae bacterium]HMW78408.1 flagellar assembly protein FliH [Rhodocyclaceae bacterium]HNE44139.1 flagellar assembly protein FliH [Rhodocyclaceae bacterium]HNL20836.1 flagellar assembly protein FliH [Rhodocyclaceae bacterium]
MPAYIPKEQLESYRRWQADAFDRPAEPEATPVPEEVASEPTTSDSEMVSGIDLPTAEDIERIHEEARAAGHDEGYQAGFAAGLESARAEAERLAALADNLVGSLAEFDQTLADDVLALAVELAGQVLRRSLAVDSDALVPVVREALAALPMHHGHVVVHVHPDDGASLRSHLGETFAHTGWQIVDDREISPGGCFLKAGSSEVDATLETRWKRVLEAIGAAPSEERRDEP